MIPLSFWPLGCTINFAIAHHLKCFPTIRAWAKTYINYNQSKQQGCFYHTVVSMDAKGTPRSTSLPQCCTLMCLRFAPSNEKFSYFTKSFTRSAIFVYINQRDMLIRWLLKPYLYLSNNIKLIIFMTTAFFDLSSFSRLWAFSAVKPLQRLRTPGTRPHLIITHTSSFTKYITHTGVLKSIRQ